MKQNNPTLDNFLQDLIKIINEKYDLTCDIGAYDTEYIYNKGLAFGYYDVLDIIRQQLNVFNIDSSSLEPIVPKLKENKYTYTELLDDLGIGREVEFFYKDIKYSITNSKAGHVFSENNGKYKVYNTVEDLIKEVRIDNKSLKEIWNDIKLDCIF